LWYAWGLVVGEFVISRSVDLHRASASPYLRLVTLAVSTNLGFGVVVDYWHVEKASSYPDRDHVIALCPG
jgi:hypothetical protein